MQGASPRELCFDFHGMRFAAQQWGDSEGLPVLALHGWLDNSASFYRLAPLLTGINIVALDMAGHGLTDHRPGVEPYNIWEDVGEVFGIADQLGWDKFSLLGHSRGAIMSLLAAGTFPDRIEKAAFLDGFFPIPQALDKAPEQLAKSILENHSPRQWRIYPTVEAMITSRENGMFKLSKTAAEALTLRGIKPLNGGYTLSSDPHLLAASAVKLSSEQLLAFADRVSAETLLILADGGVPLDYQKMIGETRGLRIETLEGQHHFHMDDRVEDISVLLNDFYGV